MNKSERPRDWNLEPGNLLYNLPLVQKSCMEVINYSERGERNEGDSRSRWETGANFYLPSASYLITSKERFSSRQPGRRHNEEV